MKKVLFVCTGNYYRSRTAEELFNHLAAYHELGWRADSRGLREDMATSTNVGPMSPHAISFLESLDVPIVKRQAMPVSLREEDLPQFDLIICMDEKEHRPMVADRFAHAQDDIIYWQVRDVQFESPKTALHLLRSEVEKLVENLRKQ